jgi:hypothetical protein
VTLASEAKISPIGCCAASCEAQGPAMTIATAQVIAKRCRQSIAAMVIGLAEKWKLMMMFAWFARGGQLAVARHEHRRMVGWFRKAELTVRQEIRNAR